MDGTRRGHGLGSYVEPKITDYGDLVAMTADGGMMHVGFGSLAVISAPLMPDANVPGDGVLGETATGSDLDSVPIDDAGAVEGDSAAGGTGDTGTTGGGAAGTGGGGGELPFTGFPAAVVAAVGAGFTAAGHALRKRVRRDDA